MIDTIIITVPYVGSGATNENFVITIPFWDPSDIIVLEDGVKQVQDVDYSVSGGQGKTGTVTWIGTTTGAIDIVRNIPLTQLLQYFTEGRFPAESHEEALDRAIMALQQCLSRSLIDGLSFTAQSRQVKDVLAGTDGSDAVNLDQLQAQTFLDSGVTIPTPIDPGQDGSHLEALGGTYILALHSEVPVPGAGDEARVLTVADAVGNFGWEDPQGVVNNFIINGGMRIAQRGDTISIGTFPVNDDDTYTLDRWNLISDGNNRADIIKDVADLPAGASAAMNLQKKTGSSALHAGIIQILDNADTRTILADGTASVVSISFKAKRSGSSTQLAMQLIGWTGTADAVVSDPILAWGAGAPIGPPPTLKPSWDSGGPDMDGWFIPQADGLIFTQTGWTQHTIPNIAIDEAGINNLALLFHITGGETSRLFITDIQLNIGARARVFQQRTTQQELALCRRYFQNYDPGTVGDYFCQGFVETATTTSHFGMPLTQQMRVAPTFAIRDAASFQQHDVSGAVVLSDLTLVESSPESISMQGTHAAGTAGDVSILEVLLSDAEIRLDAEL